MRKSRRFALVAALAAIVILPATLAQGAASAPSVSTLPATDVRDSTATLNATVDPQGQKTTYYFQYGTTTSYGVQTPTFTIGAGSGNVAVHAFIAGLQSGTTYHYRIVAQNATGTSDGADATLTTTSSHVAFLGREGFVSPGGTIGVEAGCFGGETTCTGHVTLSHEGTVIGQTDFNIAPDTGGFQNMTLSSTGQKLLRNNSPWHLLAVDVKVTTTNGQVTSQVMHLARWVWH
ncbi:MAG TPA: fibronectin type III domain-containing protein [Solirubrobacteraceae bacterium]|nr:fibronectin type III domain-containing protein [Solirubrobacteraceae bacterium]